MRITHAQPLTPGPECGLLEPTPVLAPEEVAERLAISPVTARTWLRRGKLPAVRIGGKGLLRIREADLNAYIRDLPAYNEEAGGEA